jgi:ABC-type sugar transport system ATPase subunit
LGASRVPASLRVRELDAGYGETVIVHGAGFDVDAGRTLSIVGPSGAGKSTLLRAIAGLGARDSGEVLVGGRSLRGLPPQQRRVAVVFAQDALVRHLSVRANLALAIRGPNANERIVGVARAFDIERHLPRRPAQLSTGERQRVAIARALLCDPDVLLLDEPLATLDPTLRALVRDELVHVRERFAGPMLFVTHDHADAMAVGDELAVLIDGRIVDRGDPQRVFDAPAGTAIATFLGTRPMNLLPGVLFGESSEVVVGIRPERMRIAADGPLHGSVTRIERTGADAYVRIADERAEWLVRVPCGEVPLSGSQVNVAYDSQALRRYDAATGLARA